MDAIAQICSQCGWSFDVDALRSNACKKCKSAILVTSVAYLEKFERPEIQKYISQYSATLKEDPENRDALLALGICYLKLGLFDLADKFLGTVIDAHPAEPSGYYYRAICILKGKRPRIATLSVIREAEQLISAALELDSTNGRYDILLAAIRYDYYVLNGLRVPVPTPENLLVNSVGKHIDRLEVEQVFALIRVNESSIRGHFAS